MGWWTALKGTMGTRRAERITRAEADQLLAGQPAAPSHAGLAALLSHAAAPARPEELIGEADAVDVFRRLRSAAPSIVDLSTVDAARGRHRIAGPPWRGAAVRLAVAVLLLAGAGTASITLAYRPSRMEPSPPQVPSSSVPDPSPSPSTGTHRTPDSPASPSLSPSPASFTARTGDLATATELCRVWTSTTDRAVRDRVAAQLKPLMDRLDGPNGLPAFCRKLVGAQPAANATATATGTASPAAAAKAATKAKAAEATPVAASAARSKKAKKVG
jgi:hypothetical protein